MNMTFTFKGGLGFNLTAWLLQILGLVLGFVGVLPWQWALAPFWIIGVVYFVVLTMLMLKAVTQ